MKKWLEGWGLDRRRAGEKAVELGRRELRERLAGELERRRVEQLERWRPGTGASWTACQLGNMMAGELGWERAKETAKKRDVESEGETERKRDGRGKGKGNRDRKKKAWREK